MSLTPRATWSYRRCLSKMYSATAVDMTFASPNGGAPVTIKARDLTVGVAVQLKNLSMSETKPVVAVRHKDLKGLEIDPADMVDINITLNGKDWRIMSMIPKPWPFGDALSEVHYALLEIR